MSIAIAPLDVFVARGIPHKRQEDWKYSDLRSVLDSETVALVRDVGLIVDAPAQIEQVTDTHGNLPDWASHKSGARSNLAPMEAAAGAFSGTQTALRVPAGARPAEPLRFDFRGDGHGHLTLLVGGGADLVLRETHHPDGDKLRNVSLSIFLDEGAALTHLWQAPESASLVAVESVFVHLAAGARYRAHIVNRGAKLSRLGLKIVLAGAGAEAHLNGVTVLADHAHADITTRIDHAVGNTTSRQLFKMVAGGRSRAVYQGKVAVHEGANGSDSRQTAKALLLGNRAEADLKPELEILADDVKCAHGAAVGDLDAESLFYLRARGIPEGEARALLVRAFLQEAIDPIENEEIRVAAQAFVDRGLKAAMAEAP